MFEHRPDYPNENTPEGTQGLIVGFPLRPFLVVEGPGVGYGGDILGGSNHHRRLGSDIDVARRLTARACARTVIQRRHANVEDKARIPAETLQRANFPSKFSRTNAAKARDGVNSTSHLEMGGQGVDLGLQRANLVAQFKHSLGVLDDHRGMNFAGPTK